MEGRYEPLEFVILDEVSNRNRPYATQIEERPKMTFTQRKWVATPILAAAIIIAMLLTQLGAYGLAFVTASLGFTAYLITFVAGEKQLHPVTFIIFTSALYFLAIPADLVTSTDLGGYDIDLSFYYLGAYAIFLAVFVMATPSVHDIETMDKKSEVDSPLVSTFMVVALMVSLAIYLYYNISNFGLSVEEGLDRADLVSNYSTLGQFAKAGIVSFAIFQWYLKYRYKIPVPIITWIAVVIFIAYDILILGDRRASVGLLVAVLALRSMLVGFQIKSYHVIIGIILAVLLQFWSKGRTVGLLPMVESIADGSWFQEFSFRFSESEFGGAGMVLNLKWPTLQTDFLYSYQYIFLQIIPNFILDAIGLDQPPSLSESFAQEYFTEIYLLGGGFAYNFVLEAQQNFGYLGLLIVPFVVARVPFWLARIINLPSSLSYAYFLAFGAFLIRLELSSLKSWIYACGMIVIVLILAKLPVSGNQRLTPKNAV